MGCDIHFYVEKKVKDKWKSADTFEKKDGDWYDQRDEFYGDRNYNLFAILADVRNGHGFAGSKTGEGFRPISQPRGLPDDISKETKRQSDSMGCDGHSHSWFTLRELLDYDWTQVTKLQGYIGLEEWTNWSRWDREHGKGPGSYSTGVWGRDIKHISAKEMDALAEQCNQLLRDGDREKHDAFLLANPVYALAKWEAPYYREAGDFLSETIPRLLKLAGGVKGVDDVRVVFFFDN